MSNPEQLSKEVDFDNINFTMGTSEQQFSNYRKIMPCPRLVYREEAFYCEIMYIISISIRFYSRERCLHRNGGSSIDSLAIFSDESLVLVP